MSLLALRNNTTLGCRDGNFDIHDLQSQKALQNSGEAQAFACKSDVGADLGTDVQARPRFQ